MRGVDTWPNGWAALRCPLTGTHVSDPSPKIDQPTTAPISRCLDLTCTVRRGYLCKRQLGSSLTGKRALASFNRPLAAVTLLTLGVGRAFWATTARQAGCAALRSWRSRLAAHPVVDRGLVRLPPWSCLGFIAYRHTGCRLSRTPVHDPARLRSWHLFCQPYRE